MKVRLMIGGLSKCRAVSPANRAKSERSHAEWRHKSRYGRAVATGQPAETSGVDLPQARRLAETEVVTGAGPRQRRPATQPVQGKGGRCGPTAHAYVEAGRSGIFIMISSAPSL